MMNFKVLKANLMKKITRKFDDMINFFGDLKKQNEEKKEIYNNPNDDFWDFTSFK